MTDQASLFLAQSDRDAWEDYLRSLRREDFPRWDYCFLTASDEHQARSYRLQLENRRNQGLLPLQTHFVVLPDPEGKRVGSGGATLEVLKHIARLRGSQDLAGLRILCIHSGGDSRRIPQYSVVGKLFSPVPRELPDGRPSTLFDELLITLSALAPRLREGMLLLSGDALLLFNPLQLDPPGRGVSAISFKAPAALGEHHGVYIPDSQGYVDRFLHKQPLERLRRAGGVDNRGMVDIDTGALLFAPEVLLRLLDFSQHWEGQRLSLYGDFLYPLAESATLEAFLREPAEDGDPQALLSLRKALWQALRPHRMTLLRPAPARFLHFGTTGEVLALMTGGWQQFRHLGWAAHNCSCLPQGVSGWCATAEPGVTFGKGCYLEACRLTGSTRVGDRVFLRALELRDREIPGELVLHGLKLRCGGYVVRLWGLTDDPKSGSTFLGRPLKDLFGEADCPKTLWDAPLYPIMPTPEEALDAALALRAMVLGEGDFPSWWESRRISLGESFRQADPEAALGRITAMEELARMEQIKALVIRESPVSQVPSLPPLTPVQRKWLAEQTEHLPRLEYYLGKAFGGKGGETHIRKAFHLLQQTALSQSEIPPIRQICRESVTVRLPLRVNWGGGWSDTPPYCQDRGGTVLNAAITLGGKLPVEVTLERIPERCIRLQSEDLGILGDFYDWESLCVTDDPADPFALPKAALAACGVTPQAGEPLDAFLEALGGGFRLCSRVYGVPKGSGLGTSSILCAACAQGLLQFFGIPFDPPDISRRVLVMEQLMGTGGGWQDQIGGLYPGVKLITSRPGQHQEPQARMLALPAATQKALERRFALIYTGQRRLARNLLRQVVGRYLGREPEALEVLEQIQETAVLMAFQLERGRLDAFARLLNRHWELSQKLDPGCANTLIHQILRSVSHLIDGQMICGAGGGGFLQVLLKEGVSREALEARLRQVFQDNPVALWPSGFLWG